MIAKRRETSGKIEEKREICEAATRNTAKCGEKTTKSKKTLKTDKNM